MQKFQHTFYVLFLMTMGCAYTQGTRSSFAQKYSEDLSYLRPVFVEPPFIEKANAVTKIGDSRSTPFFTINQQLHAVLDSIDRIYISQKRIDGYTIQVYSGQKREEALNTKYTMDQLLSELKAEMIYVQPTFRVKAGFYYSQLDAQKDFVAVKKYFPNAILIPVRIPLLR